MWNHSLVYIVIAANPLAMRVDASVDALPLTPFRAWERAEWRLEGAPTAGNNFDPDQIRIDAHFTAPSGALSIVPAFWYHEYTRDLVDGAQVLTPVGDPHWRLRFTPGEDGIYHIRVDAVSFRGEPVSILEQDFSVAPARDNTPLRGWSRMAPDKRYFETSNGRPLRLIGANVCWGGARGTYDYDEWFPAMSNAGANFARLWFAPWSMGLEHKPGTLNRYDLAAAWHADYVVQLAEQHGLHLVIAMDHHGMFMSNDPAWGGSNNFWTRSSPYAAENGGPCADPNEFFTRPEAHALYQKRLRYLIARYGYSPVLLSWQFFNEIDNSYLPRSALVGDDVVGWHRRMGQWLRAHDPYHHLISTSLTGASDRPEFWNLPEMDFTVYHSYGEPDPAIHLAQLSDDFARRYGKPVMIGEIGTNHLNWSIGNDPYLRGFRQGMWGAVLGGSVGTSMAWWWEDIHKDRAYPLYSILNDIMKSAGWHEPGEWTPANIAGDEGVPDDIGEPLPDAEPFSCDIVLNQLRLNRVPGMAAIPSPLAAERASERISSYLHGTSNPHLQQHTRLKAWFHSGGRLVFRVNSVAADAQLFVRVDNTEILRVPLEDHDGLATLNDEIDEEFTVALSAGRHTIEIAHDGPDWVNLKTIRLERVLPASFADGSQFTTQAVGLRRDNTVVVYARSPYIAWPAGARRYRPPDVQGAIVTLLDCRSGAYDIVWYDPTNGREVAHDSIAGENTLSLRLPAFTEDIVGIIRMREDG